ncbi:MAG TPA: glycosyltransferase family 2 protein [Terriglobales bacterium]|jgi:dolichol-phosphate mannosyltransferase|nr:glycosyltransferase family 2 protein [Terriglobales bacterium]
MTPFRLSLAIPVYNEEAVLPELLRRTREVLDRMPGGPHEIVFVDDGSSDRTPALLTQAARQDDRICAVILSRNFGHQTALTAALDYVTGDATVAIDGDLQDPPETIPLLVEKFHEGYDVVYVQRVKRKEPLWLRACFWFFYRLMAGLSDIQLPLDSGDFGLMSRRVVEQVRQMKEHHRYVRGLRSWVGFRQIGIPIERAERQAGKSKYNVWRRFKGAADGIFAFSVVPLRAATLLGAVSIVLALLVAVYSLYAKFMLRQTVPGWTGLMVSISFLSGINLLFLGIIGEYVGRIYEEIKSRPLYVVSHVEGRNVKANWAAEPTRRSAAGRSWD